MSVRPAMAPTNVWLPFPQHSSECLRGGATIQRLTSRRE